MVGRRDGEGGLGKRGESMKENKNETERQTEVEKEQE